MNSATMFYNVIENAESMPISQLGKTMPVTMHKFLSAVTQSL